MQAETTPDVHVDENRHGDMVAERAVLTARAGLISGLGFGATLLVVELLTGVPSLLSLLQDRLVSLAPGRLTSGLIDRFQFATKPLALIGLVAAQAIGIALLALLLRRLGRNRRSSAWNRPAAQGLMLAALVWALPQIILLPGAGGILGAGLLNGPNEAIVTGIAAAVAGLLYAIMSSMESIRMSTTVDAQASEEGAESGTRMDIHVSRRRLFAGALAWGTAGVTVAVVAKTIGGIGERGSPIASTPASQETGGAGAVSPGTSDAFRAPAGVSAEITPNDRFYVVSKNLVDPNLSANGWSLELKGLLDRPARFSYSDLKAMPARDTFATLECVSNSVGGDLISTTRWTGVPLADLLDRAGVQADANWIIFGSSDGYVEGLPIAVARLPTTLLVHSMNGAALPSKHGFPFRVLAPGNYGMKNPKWLTTVQASAQPPSGYWEKQGWSVESGIKTMARFDTRPRQATIGAELGLGGVAFGGDRGVSRVDISTDGGESWTATEMSRPLSKATWVLWSKSWTPERAEKAVVMVRAVDGDGHLQSAERHEPYPMGATGYDTIQIQISDRT